MAVACKISNTVCTCQQGRKPCPAQQAKWAAFVASPAYAALQERMANLIQRVKAEQADHARITALQLKIV